MRTFSEASLRWSPLQTTSFAIIVARRNASSHHPQSIAQTGRTGSERKASHAWEQIHNIAAEAGTTHACPSASSPGAVGDLQLSAGTVTPH